MIVVDANIAVHSFNDPKLLSKLLGIKDMRAPYPLFEREVLTLRSSTIQRNKLSPKEFDKIWGLVKSKIAFEEIELSELLAARELLNKLNLDVTDAEYIALCLRRAPTTFWTLDYPFVASVAANELRTRYKIFGNFSVE